MIIIVKILLSAVVIFSFLTVSLLLANSATHFKYSWLDRITECMVNLYLKLVVCFGGTSVVGMAIVLLWVIWTQM